MDTENEVSDIIYGLLQDGLVDIFTDEEGEFYFSLSDKGEDIAQRLDDMNNDKGDNNA